VLGFKGKSGAPGGTRTPDLLVRSQTLYPTELRAHCTPFSINSLPQFLIRFQPRMSLYSGDFNTLFRKVIPLIREYLTKNLFRVRASSDLPDVHSTTIADSQWCPSQLPDHTTLLITSEQVAYLDHYFQLARFFQPAMIVIEDVDLIARKREEMYGPCDESLLNKLLNEMDGLREDAAVLFVLHESPGAFGGSVGFSSRSNRPGDGIPLAR
jgi:hypothetical protein